MDGLAFLAEFYLLRGLGHELAVGIVEFHLHCFVGFLSAAIRHLYGHIETTGGTVGTLVGYSNIVVADIGLGGRIEIDVAMDAAEAPHVLTLEV